MIHLIVELFDTANPGANPLKTFNFPGGNNDPERFHVDLNNHNIADRVARIKVTKGDSYVIGDHIQLYDQKVPPGTYVLGAVISIDPDINGDVNLNRVFNGGNFADRTALIFFIKSGVSFFANRLMNKTYDYRISLYDQVQQDAPSLVFYDWQFIKGEETPIDPIPGADPPIYNSLVLYTVDLERYKFEGRAAMLNFEVINLNTGELQIADSNKYQTIPVGIHNLNTVPYDNDSSWADKTKSISITNYVQTDPYLLAQPKKIIEDIKNWYRVFFP